MGLFKKHFQWRFCKMCNAPLFQKCPTCDERKNEDRVHTVKINTLNEVVCRDCVMKLLGVFRGTLDVVEIKKDGK